jgi:hypothetical protein
MSVQDTKPHGGVTHGVMTLGLLIDNDDHPLRYGQCGDQQANCDIGAALVSQYPDIRA